MGYSESDQGRRPPELPAHALPAGPAIPVAIGICLLAVAVVIAVGIGSPQ